MVDNLVVNALKHTPRGGRVTLAAQRTADDGLTLAVSDTGEGIAPAHLGWLFQKYGRIGGQALGRSYYTGLGLVFCRLGGGTAARLDLRGERAWQRHHLHRRPGRMKR